MSATPDYADMLRRASDGLQRTVMENGMVCLVKEDHSAPVVSVQMWLGTGSADEGEQQGSGLAHYMEHMIFKGTPTRGPADITREIDDAGGEINAYTSHDRTVFHADLPAARWRTGVDVLADAVMHAALPADEWEREKQVILREMAMGNDDPDRVLNTLGWATAYRIHPYRHPIIGHRDIFQAMTREDLLAFFRHHYSPDNLIVSVAGDVSAREVTDHLRQVFAGFARRARVPGLNAVEPPQIAPRTSRQDGDYEVARLQWLYHTVAMSHPDAAALDVLAAIIGHGRSSRLNEEVKEKRQLAHEIDAWSYTPREPGLFGIYAVFDAAGEADLQAAIQAEIDRVVKAPVTAAEMDKARRTVLVGELNALQTASGQASNYAAGEFYAANPRYGEIYLERLQALTPATLQEVARRYLTAANRTVTVLVPAGAGAAAPAPVTVSAGPLQRLELAHGIPLIYREDRRLPFVHIVAVMRGGVLYETEANNGVSQLMADLMTRGTGERTAEAIARAVEDLGATLSPFAGRNSLGLQLHGLSADADKLADIFADCLGNPTFPADEVEKQREVQVAFIRQQREQPMYAAQESLRAMLFPGHPYRFQAAGREDAVAAMSREAVQAQYRACRVSGNLALAIFGDLSAKQAQALGDRIARGIPAGPAPAPLGLSAQPALPAEKIRTETREQAIVLLGYPGVDLADPRADAVNLLQKALSGLSSDLGIEIREKRGLVYYVGANAFLGIQPGFLALYAGTTTQAVAEVTGLMRAEASRLAREGLREDEFNRARAQLLAATDMMMQNTGEYAQACALNELFGLGYLHSQQQAERLARLTPAQVREAAAALLQTAREARSVVLPGKD